MIKNPPAKAGRCERPRFHPQIGRSPGQGHGSPLQYSCLENPMDRGAWGATVHGVTKSQTRLKQLSTYPCFFIYIYIYFLFYICIIVIYDCFLIFPDNSIGKGSACNAGDPSSIPGLGRYAGEGIGYPLQYSWASLVTQLVKNPRAIWETWI